MPFVFPMYETFLTPYTGARKVSTERTLMQQKLSLGLVFIFNLGMRGKCLESYQTMTGG